MSYLNIFNLFASYADYNTLIIIITIVALMLAAYAGNLEIVNLLLKRGANAHLEDNRGSEYYSQ